MLGRRTILRRSLGSALLASASCGPAPSEGRDIPPIVWSGDNLDYAPQEDAYELCRGTLPYMDTYVGLLANKMGVELDGPVVYVHGSGEETFCKRDVLGCAFDDSVYSVVAPQEHELVHGVRAQMGFSHIFFDEGAAEVFGDDAKSSIRVLAAGDLVEGIEAANPDGGLPIDWYPRAGHFFAYLRDQHGPDVTRRILDETDPWSSAGEAIAVMESATGLSFTELREDYDSQPSCAQATYRYPLYACDDPAALRPRCDDDRAVSIRERIACDDESTLGPRNGLIWKYIAVDIPRDGEYQIVTYSDDEWQADAGITIEECSMRCDAIVHEKRIELVPDTLFLRAGRYSIRMTKSADAPGTNEVRIRGEGEGEGEACM